MDEVRIYISAGGYLGDQSASNHSLNNIVIDDAVVPAPPTVTDARISISGAGGTGEALMDDALYPVMSPALFEASGRPRQPADLLGMRLLHDRDPHASWEAWRQAHGPESLDVLAGPRFASFDLVLRAAMQSQGVALARHRLAYDDVASGAWSGRSKVWASLGPAYWIVLPAHGRIRTGTSAVIDWLKQQAEPNDGAF